MCSCKQRSDTFCTFACQLEQAEAVCTCTCMCHKHGTRTASRFAATLRPAPPSKHVWLQFLGGVNVLTGPSDPHWRAVRKGVSPAFSSSRMKDAFHTFSCCAGKLADFLGRTSAPVNIDNLVLRSSMDVIGHVGFDKRMGALSSLDDPSSADQADIMIRGTHEVGLLLLLS